jgi:hypothetical protein
MKRRYKYFGIFFSLLAGIMAFVSINSCSKDVPVVRYKTEYIIVVFIDGPRYSETWGDPSHAHIPRMTNGFAPRGVVYTNFRNEGHTQTTAGHTAVSTGHYQNINNGGAELPQRPSIFQYWLKHTGESADKAWVVTSKDKLEVLTDCQDSGWNGKYIPRSNCGINGAGVGSGYRADSLTMDVVMSTLETHHPKLMLINFREPDVAGHAADWGAYLQGIRDTDEYAYQIWNFIQNDPIYKGKTTLFVTNDHGRHLDNVADGFVSHGDGCEGCRHINLYAVGPDFRQGVIINKTRKQNDITATIAEMFQFSMPTGDGDVMDELFLPLQ